MTEKKKHNPKSDLVYLSLRRLFDWLKKSLLVVVPPRGGGTPHMKGEGMLVVSLRGVNFGFWSHLECSGQNAIIFSSEGLV